MQVRAQIAMVMNLDKCIGCHTCSVTCKNVWTNRPRHRVRLVQQRRDEAGHRLPEQLGGPGAAGRAAGSSTGRQAPPQGGRAAAQAADDLLNPELPTLDDYYEPWTYDYETLTTARPSKHQPVARPRVPGHRAAARPPVGPQLGGRPRGRPGARPARPEPPGRRRGAGAARVRAGFMFYLPRICEHCLNPSCVASCPSGAMYKRVEDGIVLVDQEQCRSWRMCVSGCPYKKVYFNWSTGKAEKCTLCYPRIEAGQPTICSETCVGKIRYLGVVLYDADRVQEAASVADEKTCCPRSCRSSSTRTTPTSASRRGETGSRRTGSTRRAARRSTRSRCGTGSRCRCTPSTGRCRWCGTSRRSRR